MSYENEEVNKLNEQLAELGIKDNENRDLHNILVYLDLHISRHHEGCRSLIGLKEITYENLTFSEQLYSLKKGQYISHYHLYVKHIATECCELHSVRLAIIGGVIDYVRFNGLSEIHYPRPHNDVLFAERIPNIRPDIFPDGIRAHTTYPLRKGFNTKSARKIII